MTQQMQYLYMQQPASNNVAGVPVTLAAIDPNGNPVSINTVTSNSAGMYQAMFTPDVPGVYTIIARFDGTNSYFASSAETSLAIGQPVATMAPTPSPVASVADTYFVPAIAGLFVFIAIIGIILIVLMLRKRS